LTIFVEGDEIEPVHISAALFKTDFRSGSIVPKTSEDLKRLKKQIILESLIRNDWNISKAI